MSAEHERIFRDVGQHIDNLAGECQRVVSDIQEGKADHLSAEELRQTLLELGNAVISIHKFLVVAMNLTAQSGVMAEAVINAAAAARADRSKLH